MEMDLIDDSCSLGLVLEAGSSARWLKGWRGPLPTCQHRPSQVLVSEVLPEGACVLARATVGGSTAGLLAPGLGQITSFGDHPGLTAAQGPTPHPALLQFGLCWYSFE